jgi:hypothetical protein
MAEPAPSVVHVIAADMPAWKLGVLETLCTRSAGWHAQTAAEPGSARGSKPVGTGRSAPCSWHPPVIHVGRGMPPKDLPVSVMRVRASFDLAWLGARALGRALDCLGSQQPIHGQVRNLPMAPGERSGRTILHVWSPTALAWCLPLTKTGVGSTAAHEAQDACRLLVEATGANELAALARRYLSRPAGSQIAFACPTGTVRRRLIENGVTAEDCVVIREFVDFAALNEARDHNAHAELELRNSDTVVLALPPVVPGSGALTVAWATLLVSKVRSEVRLVVPGVGPEVDRVERMVKSIRHRHMARFSRQRFSLPELLAAADLAAYLPMGDAPVTGLVWALAAAKPIVAAGRAGRRRTAGPRS